MSSFVETGVSSLARPSWKLQISADLGWLCIVSVLALVTGIVGDQLLRSKPLGWKHRPVSEIVLRNSTVSLATLEDVESHLARSSALVLDARPRIIFDMGHLPGALSLSREQFEKDFSAYESTLRAASKPLLVYCTDADCEDGPRVTQSLQQRGFSNLLLYPGGFSEWEAAGKSVEVTP